MKRVVSVFLIGVIICFFPNSVNSEQNNCQKELFFDEINVFEIESYLSTKPYVESIREICTNDFCGPFSFLEKKNSIEIFKRKYINYVKNKSGMESEFQVKIKGFPITKITLNVC